MKKYWLLLKEKGIVDALIGLFFMIAFMLAWVKIDEFVKLVGLPFGVIPNAIGITERVDKRDIQEFPIRNNETLIIDFENEGPYYIYKSFYYDFWNGPNIYVKEPNAKIEPGSNRPRFYDTINAQGLPAYKLFIPKPGKYTFFFPAKQTNDFEYNPLSRPYIISIVPDYISGKEDVYRNAYNIQFLLLALISGGIYYNKRYLPNKKRKQEKQVSQKEKRDAFEEFMNKNTWESPLAWAL